MATSSSKRKSTNNSGKRGGGESSNHRHAPKKARAASSEHPQQQQRQRKHADLVTDGKRMWNQLRLKTNSKEQTRKLVETLMELVSGNVCEISLQHDASRVVQAAIQFGNTKERQQILQELCSPSPSASKQDSTTNTTSTMVELCKSQYAHFVVLKAIKYCQSDPECVGKITSSLKGQMVKLGTHATASRVVESLFQSFSPKETAVLKQEFYGPHFALFANELQQQNQVPTLASNLKQHPDKKAVTLDFVRHWLNKGMEKQLYGFTYFQDFLVEYLEMVEGSEIRTIASTAADHTIHLLSGRSGTKVAAFLVAYGTAKDRKRILKSIKGYAKSGLLHRDAYLAILRLVQLTDDTVSVHKNLLNELLSSSTSIPDSDDTAASAQDSPLLEIALSDTASKLFHMLLISESNAEARKKIFDPYEHSVLFLNPVLTDKATGVEVPTSKKDPEVRRKELVQHLREPLIQMCSQSHTDELLRSIPGSAVLREVYAAFNKPVSVVEAVLDVCEASFLINLCDNDDNDKTSSIFEHVVGHRAIKNLILEDADGSHKVREDSFASQFMARFGDRLTEVAKTNRGAFVVAALAKNSSFVPILKKKLDRGDLKRLSKGEGPTAGYAALLKEI